MICIECGHKGPPKTRTPGSIWVELLLWILGGLPGLYYSCWRLHMRQRVCNACGSYRIVPLDSPSGRVTQRRFYPEKVTESKTA